MAWQNCSRLQIGLLITAVLLFAVQLFFNYAAGNSDLGIFRQSTGNVSDKYDTYITPPGWTFIIWAIIYTWIAVAFGYALSQLCRWTDSGRVYNSPATLPWLFWAVFVVNEAFNISWLFAWDREKLTGAAVLLGLVCATNWLAMAILHYTLYQCIRSPEPPARREVWLVRVCVHNGLAVYTTWTTVAFLINIDTALVYLRGASPEVVSSTLGGVLTAGIIVFLALELTILDKYTRWTISPGFALIWALTGVFQQNYWRAPGSTPAVLATALAVACAALAVRLAVLVARVLRERASGGLAVSPKKGMRV